MFVSQRVLLHGWQPKGSTLTVQFFHVDGEVLWKLWGFYIRVHRLRSTEVGRVTPFSLSEDLLSVCSYEHAHHEYMASSTPVQKKQTVPSQNHGVSLYSLPTPTIWACGMLSKSWPCLMGYFRDNLGWRKLLEDEEVHRDTLWLGRIDTSCQGEFSVGDGPLKRFARRDLREQWRRKKETTRPWRVTCDWLFIDWCHLKEVLQNGRQQQEARWYPSD